MFSLKIKIKTASSIFISIFYFNLKFIICIFNFRNFSTASETLRGASFNFNAFINNIII